jgi:hypothetical protein
LTYAETIFAAGNELSAWMKDGELRTGVLVEWCVIYQLFEDFCGITVKRYFQSLILRTLLTRRDEAVLPDVSEQAERPGVSRGGKVSTGIAAAFFQMCTLRL